MNPAQALSTASASKLYTISFFYISTNSMTEVALIIFVLSYKIIYERVKITAGG